MRRRFRSGGTLKGTGSIQKMTLTLEIDPANLTRVLSNRLWPLLLELSKNPEFQKLLRKHSTRNEFDGPGEAIDKNFKIHKQKPKRKGK